MAQRRGEEYWRGQLANWQQSGLTQVAYCRSQELSIKTFARWLGKERNGRLESKRLLTLVPVRVNTPSTGSVIQIHSPSGWRIELSATPLTELAAVLRQLT